jgi:outer membrane lipase/esterase
MQVHWRHDKRRLVRAAWLLALAGAGCDLTAPHGVEEIGFSALTSASADHRQDVTETYFFGSSTTDAGNLHAAVPTVVPSPPYFEGRTSNGPVWAEYFAGLLGTDATPSALGGSNYAWGGARTGVVNFGFIPPITAQVADYLGDAGSVADPGALYLFQTAANDLTVAKLEPPETAKQTMRATVDLTEAMLTDVYDAGGRRFVLVTVPELPTAPTSAILPDGTNLAELVNDGLEALAADFEGRGAHVALFDLHGLVADIVEDPDAFGFQVTECSFMGKDFLSILFGDRTPAPCEPTVPVEGYMMFDDEHFTTTMHEIVAHELFGCHRYLRGAGSAPPVSRSRCAEGLSR